MGEVKKRKSTIRITGYNDLFGFMDPTKEPEALYDIPLDRLHEFKDHPFRVVDDAKMEELVESVRENGVLVPGIARKREDGDFELISGHRRRHAAMLAGLEDMPVFVRDYTDEEATIVMVDANLQREEILPSEKARAYKMKYDALKAQGKKLGRGDALKVMAEQTKDSRTQIQRYILLCKLIPELLYRVDSGEIRMTQAVDLSSLRKPEQMVLERILASTGWHISIAQAREIKQLSERKEATPDNMYIALNPEEMTIRRVILSKEFIDRYFPKDYSYHDVNLIVRGLVKHWENLLQHLSEFDEDPLLPESGRSDDCSEKLVPDSGTSEKKGDV